MRKVGAGGAAGTCHLPAASGCAISIPCDFSVYFYHSHPQSGRGDGGSYCAMKLGRRKSWVLSWLFVQMLCEAVLCEQLLTWWWSAGGWSWWVQIPALLFRGPEVLDMLLSLCLPLVQM